MTDSSPKHRNDIYGDIEKREVTQEAIPAATIVLVRDRSDGDSQVLMLRKNSKIAFGGMWVFPGGKIDDEDYQGKENLEQAARNAAVREAEEEAGLKLAAQDMQPFSHWTPPASTPVRFATWFFVGAVEKSQDIQVDDGEIKEFDWLTPSVALDRHRDGEIDLASPTWVTLFHLQRLGHSVAMLDYARNAELRKYETHLSKGADGVRVAMWSGDGGYNDYNADATGQKHRLVMKPGGFDFLYPSGMY